MKEIKKCNNCNSEIKYNQYICTECGVKIKRSITYRYINASSLIQALPFIFIIIGFGISNYYDNPFEYLLYGTLYSISTIFLLFIFKKLSMYYFESNSLFLLPLSAVVLIFSFLIIDLTPEITYNGTRYVQLSSRRQGTPIVYRKNNLTCSDEIVYHIYNDSILGTNCGSPDDYIAVGYNRIITWFYNYRSYSNVYNSIDDDGNPLIEGWQSKFRIYSNGYGVKYIGNNFVGLVATLYMEDEAGGYIIPKLENSSQAVTLEHYIDDYGEHHLISDFDLSHFNIVITKNGITTFETKDGQRVFERIPDGILINPETLEEFGYGNYE